MNILSIANASMHYECAHAIERTYKNNVYVFDLCRPICKQFVTDLCCLEPCYGACRASDMERCALHLQANVIEYLSA